MVLWKRIKNSIDRFLLQVADENKKSFGEGRLDCCQLNQKKSTDKTK